MEAPKKLYIDTEDILSDSILYGFTEKRKEDDIEYIRKDIVGDMLANAEDHAYLAGSEAMKNKTVKWLEDELYVEKVNRLYPPMSIVISKSYESVDEIIQGFKKIN